MFLHSPILFIKNGTRISESFDFRFPKVSRWENYEPFWHTGQLINGLLNAHSVVREPKFLESAIKAADWWSSYLITNSSSPLNGMINATYQVGGLYLFHFLLVFLQ